MGLEDIGHARRLAKRIEEWLDRCLDIVPHLKAALKSSDYGDLKEPHNYNRMLAINGIGSVRHRSYMEDPSSNVEIHEFWIDGSQVGTTLTIKTELKGNEIKTTFSEKLPELSALLEEGIDGN